MIPILWGAIVVAIIVLLLPLMHHIRLRTAHTYPPTTQFSVAVIVPCKGNNDPDFENNLLNIVQQDYDANNVQFVLCVESNDDTALPVLRRIEAAYKHVTVCVAGIAVHCSQKTFNVVCGMRKAGETDIFVIADADIQPHTTWLQELVGPFVDDNIQATTGFFRRVPLTSHAPFGNYMAGIFSSIIITGISDDILKSLWGGSLAIRKSLLDTHNIYNNFLTEIVDDVALMHMLHVLNMERRYVQSCTLKSYCDMSAQQTFEWFVRQIQYLQIYFPLLYRFFYTVIVLYSFAMFLTPLTLLYGIVMSNMPMTLLSASYWLLFFMTGILSYYSTPINPNTIHPNDTPFRLGQWLLFLPLGFVYGTWAMVKTSQRVCNGILVMNWRNIEYHVEVKTGRVLAIVR